MGVDAGISVGSYSGWNSDSGVTWTEKSLSPGSSEMKVLLARKAEPQMRTWISLAIPLVGLGLLALILINIV
jgi:hypothetical protein